MLLLVHVAVPIMNAAAVQAEIESCCAETGDLLIGRRDYCDSREVLLIVRLLQKPSLTQHTRMLNQALQQGVIVSFQPEATNLIRIQCNFSHNMQELMCQFPLQMNESWFPSVEDVHVAYLCTRRSLMGPVQAAWLSHYEMDYRYA